ncbi:MAG: Uma2 family endonuclease [Planctomycetota bacterium]|nr:MAG: Uma2 family endonuclease [Planctomycetota bacterium]REJ87298.1 MAG: Uma2 family endonuclease [Planctomycetota bacterium]REJ87795.1 MAG: Uma2 family endonuclease [Planctomycetota bacterium]REK27878.1 MAG: Uma2 family endonuclease [Planctomycetota bacterium]REK32810.1 MAG: Uma2 family endonuclease [Planctomycetota bacterium]
MSAVLEETVETMADVLERLGHVPADRVLTRPQPGTATEKDLLRLPNDVRRMCELVDGTLVVKAMGAPESAIAAVLLMILGRHPGLSKVAAFLGPDGLTRYFGDQIRMPDVAVILRSRLPGGKLPKEQICPVPPDLAVEILSPGNTEKEIERKLGDFFASEVRLVWIVDPQSRTVRVYTSAQEFTEFGEDDTLDGGDVLPGFTLSIRDWFDEAE